MKEICKKDPLKELNFIGNKEYNRTDVQKNNSTKIQSKNKLLRRAYYITKEQDTKIKLLALNNNKFDYEIIQEAIDNISRDKIAVNA